MNLQSVAIYTRLSLDRDDTGLGVARQEQECRQYAAERGWTVSRVYVDNDISATSGKCRPAFEELLEDRPDSVVVEPRPPRPREQRTWSASSTPGLRGGWRGPGSRAGGPPGGHAGLPTGTQDGCSLPVSPPMRG